MGQGYFAKQDVIMRLDNTVCMYDGEPVVVRVNPEDPTDKVDIFDLKSYSDKNKKRIKRTVEYTDNTFVYKAFPLGYAFVDDRYALYINRTPSRQQSQGLSQYVLSAIGKETYITVAAPYMYNCIKGIYPTVQEAVKMVTSCQAESVPFDRKFAVGQVRRGVVSLLCRGRDVGLLINSTENNPKFKLFDIKEAQLIAGALQGKATVLQHGKDSRSQR